MSSISYQKLGGNRSPSRASRAFWIALGAAILISAGGVTAGIYLGTMTDPDQWGSQTNSSANETSQLPHSTSSVPLDGPNTSIATSTLP
ncbi:hypothetical protein BDN72DRAFT_843737 [Pluteus cervinus]|uniref:Uncharacterized protein n=1 Tax=Pluteus cervinus TaxID=181527 RepID=A0ACD3ALR2_9AGAR|nr:hypothetical protein BDN72DRAFT_843737 [Pluteus cervinus]